MAKMKLQEILNELHITQLEEGFDAIYIEEIMKGELPIEDIKQLIAMQFPPGGAEEPGAGGDDAAAALLDLPDVPGGSSGGNDEIDSAAFEDIQKRLAGLDMAPGSGAAPDEPPAEITPESLDMLLPDTPGNKSAKPASNPFPAAPKAGGNSPFPAAPKSNAPAAGGNNPFPAAPRSSGPAAGGSNPFPAAPRSSGPAAGGNNPFPAAPRSSGPAASPFPAAPAARAAPKTPDIVTVSAQVNQLFMHYYPGQAPPAETVQYYVQQVTSGAMTIDQVQDQIREALARYKSAVQSSPAASPAKAAPAGAAPAKQKPPVRKPRYSLEDDGRSFTKDEAQAFVDWLYIKFCGGVNKGDVAAKPRIVRDLCSGQYSKKMACWTVQRSKEAVKYAEVKKGKRTKIVNYITKAAKIVCPKNMPSSSEIALLAELVLDQEITLDDVESDLALRA